MDIQVLLAAGPEHVQQTYREELLLIKDQAEEFTEQLKGKPRWNPDLFDQAEKCATDIFWFTDVFPESCPPYKDNGEIDTAFFALKQFMNQAEQFVAQ
jgi:hypothetical protein